MTQNGYSVTEKVIRQLEYYFGNANLSRDTFLMGEMSKDNGWVSIDTMLRVSNLEFPESETQKIFSSNDSVKL